MSDLSNLTVGVIDNGLFVDIALKIAPAFKQVYYWSPWQGAFPFSSKMLPGDGFEEITRVKWKMPMVRKCDLLIYPDVYWGDEAEDFRNQGMKVWSAGRGERLELDRVFCKELLAKLGEPVGPWWLVTGVPALREFLHKRPDVWVKTSCNRGDFETFHSENYELIEPRVDEVEHRLGAKADVYQFVVEASINDALELGYDGFCIDGQFPARSFFGLERKDLGFIGKVVEWDDFPPVMKRSNEALTPFFNESQYRGFYSSELRITDPDTAYLIDPCCRAASPPHEIYLEIFNNWPEIFYEGAQGHIVDPEPTAEFGVCAMIHSSWATKNWLPLRIPDAIRAWVKIRNHCRIKDVDYFVPQPDSDLPEIGAVIGLGNTLEEAEDHLRDNAEQLKGYDIDVKLECLHDMREELEEAEKFGIGINILEGSTANA